MIPGEQQLSSVLHSLYFALNWHYVETYLEGHGNQKASLAPSLIDQAEPN